MVVSVDVTMLDNDGITEKQVHSCDCEIVEGMDCADELSWLGAMSLQGLLSVCCCYT